VANSEARALGETGATFNMADDTTLGFNLSSGDTISVVFPGVITTADEAAAIINTAVAAVANVPVGDPPNDPVAILEEGRLALHSRNLGRAGHITVSEGNIALGLTGDDGGTGATVGDIQSITAQETILLDPSAAFARTRLRYTTVQFGVLEIKTSINDTAAVAYILHPDHLEDLIAFQP
jgi:hypothetical protein